MAFELKILTDLSVMPKVVETNIDDIQPVIDAAIAKTKGLEVTDNKDEIIAADEDAAKLTKMATALQRFRIDHIAIWKEPMEAFEKKCKESEAKLKKAAEDIRSKTGEVKELWRQRKREKCLQLWMKKLDEAFSTSVTMEKCPHVTDFFTKWTDPKTKGTWVNSSVSEKTVIDAMDAEIQRMKDTFAAFSSNYAGQPEEVLARAELALFVHFDLNDVIQTVEAWKKEQAEITARAEAERQRKAEADAKMEAAKKELAERRAKEEADAAEAAAKAEAEKKAAEAAAPVAPAPTPAPEAAPVETYKLAVTGTREALMKLRQFGESIGITFKNIGNGEEA